MFSQVRGAVHEYDAVPHGAGHKFVAPGAARAAAFKSTRTSGLPKFN